LATLNRLPEAVASLQQLQIAHDRVFGRQHKYYGLTLIALARAQHLSGNARAARCLYDKVCNHPARLFFAAPISLPYAQQAVPLLARLLGSQHHEVISANVAYASALMELQQVFTFACVCVLPSSMPIVSSGQPIA
jgi:hypothetical protein